MIKMLTVGAFGNDMAADPSLISAAAASSVSSDTSHARMLSALSPSIVAMGQRGSEIVTVSCQVAHPLTFCHVMRRTLRSALTICQDGAPASTRGSFFDTRKHENCGTLLRSEGHIALVYKADDASGIERVSIEN